MQHFRLFDFFYKLGGEVKNYGFLGWPTVTSQLAVAGSNLRTFSF